MVAFDAEAAAYVRDEAINAETLVLVENADGSGRRLEIQRSLVVSDQDREHGMDTDCLVDHDDWSHHGGVTSWGVRDRVLRMELDEAAAAEMSTEGFEIRLVGDAMDDAALRERLRDLLT